MNKTTVIIAEDHKLFGLGMAQLLNASGEYEILHKLENGELLLDFYKQQQADLIISDINMPKMSGLDAALHIRQINPAQKIVFVSMYFDATIHSFCRKHNISFIMKDCTTEELYADLRKVLRGDFVCPKYTDASERVMSPKDEEFLRSLKLSNREIEIIQLVKKGLSSRAIAEQLFLSEYTVETHRKNIFRKTGVKSVGELIAFANANGI